MATKRTWQPKKIPRKREHGFLKRMSTRGGRDVLKARRLKGRKKISCCLTAASSSSHDYEEGRTPY